MSGLLIPMDEDWVVVDMIRPWDFIYSKLWEGGMELRSFYMNCHGVIQYHIWQLVKHMLVVGGGFR